MKFLFLLTGIISGIVFNLPITMAVEGGSLYLEPAGGRFTVGSTFTVNIFVNTGQQPINLVEVDLKFPPDKLQVVSPTTGISFFKILLGPPNYSNAEGTVNIKGGLPSPGIKTEKGLITTITFRVKSTGQANISFTDESKVLADDGRATNLLKNSSGAILDLILPPPAGPIIISPTHPDQEKWSSNNEPLFIWTQQPDVNGFSYLLNNDPVDVPDNIINGDVPRVKYHDLKDGIYFFHLKAYSSVSGWGGVSHYQILVDKTPPAGFLVSVEPRARTTVRRPFILFSSSDNLSGMDHFELKIVKADTSLNEQKIDDPKTKSPFFIEAVSPYQAPELDLGKYDIIVRAYDKSGSFTEAQTNLQVTEFLLQPFGEKGFMLGGSFVISWRLFWLLTTLLFIFLCWLARHFWQQHQDVRIKLGSGLLGRGHSGISENLKKLKELQKKYFNE